MAELNPIIHQPTRLRIMATLVSLEKDEKADFVFLRDFLELTDGNLSVHLSKLEGAEYVMVEKAFVKRRPKTWICATMDGRNAFAAHVDALEAIVGLAR